MRRRARNSISSRELPPRRAVPPEQSFRAARLRSTAVTRFEGTRGPPGPSLPQRLQDRGAMGAILLVRFHAARHARAVNRLEPRRERLEEVRAIAEAPR